MGKTKESEKWDWWEYYTFFEKIEIKKKKQKKFCLSTEWTMVLYSCVVTVVLIVTLTFVLIFHCVLLSQSYSLQSTHAYRYAMYSFVNSYLYVSVHT